MDNVQRTEDCEQKTVKSGESGCGVEGEKWRVEFGELRVKSEGGWSPPYPYPSPLSVILIIPPSPCPFILSFSPSSSPFFFPLFPTLFSFLSPPPPFPYIPPYSSAFSLLPSPFSLPFLPPFSYSQKYICLYI